MVATDSKIPATDAPIVVDSDVLAVIKRAEAPQGVPKAVHPPPTLPGRLNIVEGVLAVFRVMREGVGYSVAARERWGEIYRTRFAGNPMVVVWNADEIHKILKNEDQAWSAAMGWDLIMFHGLDP